MQCYSYSCYVILAQHGSDTDRMVRRMTSQRAFADCKHSHTVILIQQYRDIIWTKNCLKLVCSINCDITMQPMTDGRFGQFLSGGKNTGHRFALGGEYRRTDHLCSLPSSTTVQASMLSNKRNYHRRVVLPNSSSCRAVRTLQRCQFKQLN